LFLVIPEQRRLGIGHSHDWHQDWMGTRFYREEDLWLKRGRKLVARGRRKSATGCAMGIACGHWAERGGYDAMGHGNWCRAFHVTWGTGPGTSSRSSGGHASAARA
jgi:predicted oxidoreductase